MGTSDDEGVAFRSNALDIVSSWLLGGDGNEDKIKQEMQQKERRPVTLYRPSSSSAPSLTRPTAAHVDATLTETEREMKRKLLRKSRGSQLEETALAEKEVQTQWDEAQDEEEQELVRLKTQTPKDDRKRKRTVQDELLDKLREDAAKKKAKNLKRKLQLQRKKQQQQRQLNQNDVTAAN